MEIIIDISLIIGIAGLLTLAFFFVKALIKTRNNNKEVQRRIKNEIFDYDSFDELNKEKFGYLLYPVRYNSWLKVLYYTLLGAITNIKALFSA